MKDRILSPRERRHVLHVGTEQALWSRFESEWLEPPVHRLGVTCKKAVNSSLLKMMSSQIRPQSRAFQGTETQEHASRLTSHMDMKDIEGRACEHGATNHDSLLVGVTCTCVRSGLTVSLDSNLNRLNSESAGGH